MTSNLFPEQWVNVPTVARHLGVSRSWVNKAVLDEAIPVRRVGRSLRFRLSEIDAWLSGDSDVSA
jgi:excisionase family DNA binding protein